MPTETPTTIISPKKNDGSSPPSVAKNRDLEIKDPVLIFNAVWSELEQEFGREQNDSPRKSFCLVAHPVPARARTRASFFAPVASPARLSW